MKTVGSYQAKTYLPRLLDEVVNGETITSTKHGRPVARLVPPSGAEKPDVGKAIDEWRACRREHGITLGPGMTIKEMLGEGRM